MKKLLFTLACSALLFMGCNSDDDSNDSGTNETPTIAQIQSTAQSGTWRITYFFDSDEDETSNFNGYVFTFNSNGIVSAVHPSETVTGNWSITSSSSSSSSSNPDFNLFFPVNEDHDFDDLIDDWDVIQITDTTIELIDVSGGNGGTDYLTFTKN